MCVSNLFNFDYYLPSSPQVGFQCKRPENPKGVRQIGLIGVLNVVCESQVG